MPVIHQEQATVFETHGSRFHSYVALSSGGTSICAWRLEVPPNLRGVAHRPSREEVLLVLEGVLDVTLDGTTTAVEPGCVVLVPADTELRIDSGPSGAAAWVTTTPGLSAVMSDGTKIAPPWAN